MKDFRSEKSESPEGKGIARRAWDNYAKAVNAVTLPLVTPGLRVVARAWTVDLVGFWVCWHLYGGFEGLVQAGFHPSTIWRKVKRFRLAFGVHPDEYRMPGVTINPRKAWDSAAEGLARGEQLPFGKPAKQPSDPPKRR